MTSFAVLAFSFSFSIVFTARGCARAVLGVVILSVCPSFCLSHACIVTKLNDALQILYITRKGNHSVTLIPRVGVVGRRRPLPSEICVQSDPPPSKRRLRPISAHNVSTVGDSEKSSITTNIKSTTGFATSQRWSAYVTPKCPKGWLKDFFFFWVKVNGWSSQALSTSFAGQWYKHLMVGGNVDHTHRVTVDKCM